jgi:hypothetical protein
MAKDGPGTKVQSKQTQIRMDVKLRRRIDQYRAKIRRDSGFEVPFSTAVRTLIEKGLEVA